MPTYRKRMDRNNAHAGSMVELLRQRAAQEPGSAAYTFLVDGDEEKLSLSYAELDRGARRVAGYLQSLSMTDERALLLHPHGLDYLVAFWGCLYARVVPIPLNPPGLKSRSVSRIQAIAGDSQCKLVLTTQKLASVRKPALDQISQLSGMRLVATDGITADFADGWRPPHLTPETLAHLQYTSGSTSVPKGVMVTHGNLLHNLGCSQRAMRYSPEDIFVSWAPFFHDMGLVQGVLMPVYVGARCVLLSPESFAQRPLRWLSAISRARATTSCGSNFAYELCVNRIPPREREALDLSCWTSAVNGSEPVRAETVDKFVQAFEPHGFRRNTFFPAYGLAEATLGVSCGPAGAAHTVNTLRLNRAALEAGRVVPASATEASQHVVGCGQVYPEYSIAIVDPESRVRREPDRVGEIWLSGKSVAGGYWNRPDETEAIFRARVSGTGEGPFLRTGDLGLIRGGELYVAGRIKDLIIIRGRNLYPQDIELTVEGSHPAMQPGGGVAFSIDRDNEERLVIVQEVQRGRHDSLESIAAAVRRAVLKEHDVQPDSIVLVRAGSILKTSSGKIQRRACREAYLNGGLVVAVAAPADAGKSPRESPDARGLAENHE